MKKIIFNLTALILVFMFSETALSYEWKKDSGHSAVMFEIDHIYSATRGQFNDFSTKFFFNPGKLNKSKIEFVVQVDSIDTNISKRDGHLRSKDFFDEKKYPQMKFSSTQITHIKDDKYEIQGNLSIKDVSKLVKIKATFMGEKEHPFKKGTIVGGFETKFNINRLDYNIGNGRFYNLGVLGKDVEIFISMEMFRDK